MFGFFSSYAPLLDLILIGSGYAFSQYIVLRSGAFSVATSGLAAIGAYTAAILTVKHGVHPAVSVLIATLAGLAAGLLLAAPLARLRGVYQAIASLAFVQIVESLNLHFDEITGGPLGFNGIPRTVYTPALLIAVAAVIYLLVAIDRGGIGRVFEAMRQDVAVPSSLGVNPTRYHALAFALSGAIAGLFGALDAFKNYNLTPEQFGFSLTVAALSYVILGGRRSVVGPIVGATILITLPELSRPLAENRMAIYGLLLMFVIGWMPYGVADTLIMRWRRIRLASAARDAESRAADSQA